ncbi:MAG: MFS transporter [Actinomycetota bacterium]|nr:MFS transporter [Actinomycetota bacterium]
MQHSYEGLDRAGGFSRANLLSPLRHRDFRVMWTGMTISLLGDGIFLVAMAWQVYAISNTPKALAFVGIAMTVPHIAFLLVGGAISDRFDRRLVMLFSDAVRGTAIAAVAVLSLTGSLQLPHMIALVALYGAGTAFFGPAFDAIVPDVLPRDQLAQANSLDQFIRPIALRLAGPAVGGLLIGGIGVGAAFAVNATSFVASAAALMAMHSRPPRPARADASMLREIREGFSYVRANVWLWGTFLAATFAYLIFMGPTEVLLPYMVKNQLHGSARDLGFVFASGGVGAIGAAVLMSRHELPRRTITFMYTTWTLATLAIVGYGLAAATWQLMVACLAFNALETAGTIVWATAKQRHVPTNLLGRVSSLDWLISIGLLPLSFALTGPAAAALGVRTTLVLAGIAGALITLAPLFLPGMRDLERQRDELDIARPVEPITAPSKHAVAAS